MEFIPFFVFLIIVMSVVARIIKEVSKNLGGETVNNSVQEALERARLERKRAEAMRRQKQQRKTPQQVRRTPLLSKAPPPPPVKSRTRKGEEGDTVARLKHVGRLDQQFDVRGDEPAVFAYVKKLPPMQRAIVMMEILGPPVILRNPRY